MANPLLRLILGGLFAKAMRGQARRGPFGGSASGGMEARGGGDLGDALGGMIGRGLPANGRIGSNRGMLMAVLLPLAMQWVQRNGGIGAVLERFKQKGYGRQAKSWVSTRNNEVLDAEAVNNVVGRDELSRLSAQLGVREQDVVAGFAEILPEVVDQLSPEGEVPPEADEALNTGLSALEKELSQLTTGAPA